MLRLLRFRSGYAAELPKFSTINFAAAVFDCCFIAQTHYFFTAILPKFNHKISIPLPVLTRLFFAATLSLEAVFNGNFYFAGA